MTATLRNNWTLVLLFRSPLLSCPSNSVAQVFNLESDSFKIGDVYVVNPKIVFNYSKATFDSISIFSGKNNHLIIEVVQHKDNRGDQYS